MASSPLVADLYRLPPWLFACPPMGDRRQPGTVSIYSNQTKTQDSSCPGELRTVTQPFVALYCHNTAVELW